MKILVLNGSPKREASDTMHMTRAFLEGMNDVERQEVEILSVIDQKIAFCTGCLGCMRNGGRCVHHDDMDTILEKILHSDLLLFSFPLYCYGMPAPLKALIDRTLPLSSIAMRKVGDHYEHVGQRDFSGLRYLMISGCGFPNRENNFEPAVMQFRRMFGGDATVIAVAQAPMFGVPEAKPVTAPFLETVREAGREYAKSGMISERVMEKLRTPMIPQEIYAQIVNSQVN
ncbi:MAG: flavodoxin family protein [Fusicatenibacter sp.]